MNVVKDYDVYVLMFLFITVYVTLAIYGVFLASNIESGLNVFNVINVLVRLDSPIKNDLSILLMTHHTLGIPIMLRGYDLLEGFVWELLTSLFIHANLYHLFFNCLALLIIRSIYSVLEPRYGITKVFLVGGLFSNLCFAITSPDTYSVGASGGIFTVFAWIALRNYLERGDNVPLILLIFTLLLSSIPIVGSPNVVAHLVGSLIGFSIAIYRRR